MKYAGVLVIYSALCLYGACSTAWAAPAQESGADTGAGQPTPAADDIFVITGRVVIYGSEPFTFAGIDSEDGKVYAVYPPETERQLWVLQGHRMEFTVRVLDRTPDANALYLGGETVTPLSWRIID
jgi:hypothetical protein